MPLYEYSCDKCKHTFELMRNVNETTKVNCPKCGLEAKKMISATSFQLKGTGWYKTDYQNKCTNKKPCEGCNI
jgi:putative FmdB family regulatory protein